MTSSTSTVLFSNRQFAVVRDQNQVTELDYTYVKYRQHGVRIIARNVDGSICLVKQSRHPLAAKIWEIPAGGVEPHESALEARSGNFAKRLGWKRQFGQNLALCTPYLT
jgi:hypothetical protein